jgi:hypothetical protein
MQLLSTYQTACLGLLLLAAGPAAAQSEAPQPLPARRGLPVFVSVQIGGGAGMVAVGGGLRLAHQRLEPEVLVGRVPRRFSNAPLTIFTFKTTYLPVSASLGSHGQVASGVGGYVSYTHGSTLLNSHEPGKYTKGYYWFSTRVRTGFFLAPRLAYKGLRTTRHPEPPYVATYAELGTNDLYFLSRTTNKRAPSLRNILTLGVGSKVGW